MKLELKHLSSYLPYGIKGDLVNLEYFDSQINCELYRIETGKTKQNSKYEISVIVGDCESDINDFKPYLRPLSDLTREIEVNGSRFVPIEVISAYSTEIELLHDIKYGFISVIFWDMLLSWHFDLYSLIDTGLAVDINTVK